MLIFAIIIYIIGAVLAGPLWILDMIFGKAGILGFLLGIGWCVLFFAGLS
jgi:hypothetical protein